MRAAWLENGQLSVRDLPGPDAAPGWARIRVTLAGICGTDLELARGYKGGFAGVPGHEFVGVVEAAPDAPEWLGRRVTGSITIACGSCDLCRAGLPGHCRNRRVLGVLGHPGALADCLTLPVANLHAVPDSVPDAAAVFCEPLAAALQVLEQVTVTPQTRAAVVGDGRLGLPAAWALARTGAAVTLFGHHPERTDWGAERGVRWQPADSGEPRAFDLVLEATGAPGGAAAALRLVRPRGTLVLKSTMAAPATLNLAGVVVDEITVVGSRCGPFPKALAWLAAADAPPVARLVAAEYPLDRAPEAWARAQRPGTLKVLLRPGIRNRPAAPSVLALP